MLALARRCAAEIVEGLGGGLGPSAGDQMIAGFGVPVTREDDVARCARP
jgi:class 3 adenylate cyclase